MAPIKAKEVMLAIQAGVEREGEKLVKQVKGVVQYIIKGGDEGEWVIDLKNGAGKVYPGKAPKADITITINDDDMVAMADGKLNPQQAPPVRTQRKVCSMHARAHRKAFVRLCMAL